MTDTGPHASFAQICYLPCLKNAPPPAAAHRTMCVPQIPRSLPHATTGPTGTLSGHVRVSSLGSDGSQVLLLHAAPRAPTLQQAPELTQHGKHSEPEVGQKIICVYKAGGAHLHPAYLLT